MIARRPTPGSAQSATIRPVSSAPPKSAISTRSNGVRSAQEEGAKQALEIKCLPSSAESVPDAALMSPITKSPVPCVRLPRLQPLSVGNNVVRAQSAPVGLREHSEKNFGSVTTAKRKNAGTGKRTTHERACKIRRGARRQAGPSRALRKMPLVGQRRPALPRTTPQYHRRSGA